MPHTSVAVTPNLVQSATLVLKLAALNLALSSDNAVAVGLASRGLTRESRHVAVLLGTVFYVVVTTGLAAFSSAILCHPWVRPVAAAALIGIGARRMNTTPVEAPAAAPRHQLGSAVATIFLTDLATSTENVVALAAAANGHFTPLAAAILISAPVPVYAGGLLSQLFTRFPSLVVISAALLGAVAGQIVAAMPAVAGWLGPGAFREQVLCVTIIALLTVALGRAMHSRTASRA